MKNSKTSGGATFNSVHLFNPLFQPRDIMVDAARPAVLKTADFPRVSPDDPIIPVAEKERVKVDKVNAVRFQRFENFQIVAKDKFIDGHFQDILFEVSNRTSEHRHLSACFSLPAP
jgi:hypothetical protein